MHKRDKEDGGYGKFASVGNYTKYAVENFEQGIVNEKDFLEKSKEDRETQMPHKFH
jgi:hypothetical protein